jgi:hypothetical protein
MDPVEVDRMIERPLIYWYEDGIAEMLSGLVLAAIGVLEGLWGLGAYGMLVASLFALLLGSRTVIALKRRLVFPRAGAVEYSLLPTKDGEPMPLRHYLLWLAAPALIVYPAVYAFARLRSRHGLWLDGLGMIGNPMLWIGPLWAVVIAMLARQTRVSRFLALAALSMVLGLAAGVVAGDSHLALALYYLGMGVGVFVSGALAFARFVRRHPRLEAEQDAE